MKKFLISFFMFITLFSIIGCSNSEIKDGDVTKVFVYGSLRSDMYNYKKYLDGKVIDNQKGTIKGDLFHLDGKGENTGYPAVIPGEGIVKGELMEFKAFHATLDELDELESYKEDNIEQNEYNRKLVDVTLEDGSTVKAYYYEYNLNADCNKDDNRVPVKDGDWKEFMESKM